MKGFLSLWGWPSFLGLTTASGLLSALLSDGAGDVWSWFALGFPIAAALWFVFFGSRAVRTNPKKEPPG